MLQPDEFNREIQQSKEKLTQEGDISTCCIKSKKAKKGEYEKNKKECNYFDTCFSQTQQLLTSKYPPPPKHALMIFQWLIRVELGSNKKPESLVSWLSGVNEGGSYRCHGV